MLAWGPVLYCGIYPAYSADTYGPYGFQVFFLLAVAITIFFITVLVRWLLIEGAEREEHRR
jgi:Na+/H+ antiporter NhaC